MHIFVTNGGEIEDTKRKGLCVDSKNIVEMFDKAKAGLTYIREGIEAIKYLSLRFPPLKMVYVNRR